MKRKHVEKNKNSVAWAGFYTFADGDETIDLQRRSLVLEAFHRAPLLLSGAIGARRVAAVSGEMNVHVGDG
jgi:hypothetical protein